LNLDSVGLTDRSILEENIAQDVFKELGSCTCLIFSRFRHLLVLTLILGCLLKNITYARLHLRLLYKFLKKVKGFVQLIPSSLSTGILEVTTVVLDKDLFSFVE
jgi:hypothetical protein